MSIATAKVEELRDLAQEIIDEADNLTEIREADRGAYDATDREEANDSFESAVRRLVDAIPSSVIPQKVK